jgi:subtilase family serine protease
MHKAVRLFAVLGVASQLIAICGAYGGLPDLAPIGLQVPDPLIGPPNPSTTVIFGVTNQGTDTAYGWWYDSVFCKSNGTPDASALEAAQWYEYGPLAPGTSYWQTNPVTLPITASGVYSLIFTTDFVGFLSESIETNNQLRLSFSYQSIPADLVPIALQAPTVVTGPPNPTITVVWGITNQGIGPAVGSWNDYLFLSTNAVLDSQDYLAGSSFEQGPVAPGTTYWRTNLIRLPITQDGTYYLILQADQSDSLYELQTNNNQIVLPITFHILPPDLAPLTIQLPSTLTLTPRPTIPLVWAVTNMGPGEAMGYPVWNDYLYISTNAFYDPSAMSLTSSSEYGPVEPGEVYWRTNLVQLPIVQTGMYYFILSVNEYGLLFEPDRTNNTLIIPAQIEILPPDLAPDISQIPTAFTTAPNPVVSLVWGVTNEGIGAAVGNWDDSIGFSANPSIVGWNTLMYEQDNGPLLPGETAWHTNGFQLPITQSGTYYFQFNIDNFGFLYESNEGNNVAVVPISFTIQPADLVLTVIKPPTVVTSTPNPTLTLNWAVTNQGLGSLPSYQGWADAIYFSRSGVLDGSQTQVWFQFANGPLNAGTGYERSAQVTLPAFQSGAYYLIFVTDAYNSLFESNKSNNTVVVPITLDILQPDLQLLTVQAPNQITGPPYPTATVAWSVANRGLGSALGSWSDLVYFSTNNTLDGSDPWLLTSYQQGPLPPGGSYWVTNSISLPVVTSGSYFLIFQTDPGNNVYESDTSNNIVVKPVNVTINPPDLAPVAFPAPTVVTSPPNPTIAFAWAITNQGSGDALSRGQWTDAIFLSTNSTLDPTATLLGNFAAPANLPSGSSYWQTNSIRVPVVKSGTYYFFLSADFYDNIFETDESNNVSVVRITFIIQPPDLKPIGLQAPSQITASPNPTITYAWGVTNQGIGAALADNFWRDSLFLSLKSVLDYSAIPLFSTYGASQLMPGGSYWITNFVKLPVTTNGTYYLLLETDANNDVFELDENNNVIAVPIVITVLPPDLAPLSLQVQAPFDDRANPTVLMTWGVTNQGVGAATDSWIDEIKFSSDTNFGFGTTLDSLYRAGPLSPGGSYWVTNSARLPVIQSGTYYLSLQVNDAYYYPGEYQFESNVTNNSLVVPITLSVKLPDLAPVLLLVSNQLAGSINPSVSVWWGITNQGAGVARYYFSWSDQLYLSTNAVLDNSAIQVGNWGESGPIAAGHTYWRTHTVQLPLTVSGDYYLILVTDVGNAVPESNETNNIISARIHFNAALPDLAPIAFIGPGVVSAPANPLVNLVWGVTNQGIGSAQASLFGGWYDQIYLSQDDQFDPLDLQLATFGENGPVTPGSSYWRTNRVRLPINQSGTYYLIFKTDSNDALPELDKSNNVAVASLKYNFDLPDLVPISLQAPKTVTGPPYSSITLVWGVTNQGNGTAISDNSWWDSVYLTSDPAQPAQFLSLGSTYHYSNVDPGGTYWVTNTSFLPVATNGNWYLVLKVNDYGYYLTESDTNNNTLTAPITLNIAKPDLVPIALQAPSIVTAPTTTVVLGVTNQGAGPAATPPWYSWQDGLWLSTNSSLDGIIVYVGIWPETGPIPVGGSYWRTNKVNFPVQLSGDYYLVFETDPANQADEQTTTNNFIFRKITFDPKSPDLAPILLQAPASITGPPFPTVMVAWGVTNQGPGAAVPGYFGNAWNDSLAISTNANIDGIVQYAGSWRESNAVAPGQVYWRTNTVTLPLTQSGRYYLIFTANSYGLLEPNTSNNVISVPLTFNAQVPDLAVFSWQAPTQIVSQPWPMLTFVVGITNQGQGSAIGKPTWTDSLYLSEFPFLDLDGQARPLGWWTHSNTVAPGSSYWQTNTVTIPVVDSADYFLFFVANDYNNLGEQQLTNNTVMQPLSLNLSPPADLAVDLFQVPPLVIGTATPTVTLVAHVLNQGLGPAIGTWSDVTEILGSGTVFSQPYRQLQSTTQTRSLQPGQGYWQTNVITMPEMQSGQYGFAFSVDRFGNLYDADRSNNSMTGVTDFSLTAPEPPRIGQGGFALTGSFVLEFYGSFGPLYALEVSTNLEDWQPLFSFFCNDTPMLLNDMQPASPTGRFYRVVTPPPSGTPGQPGLPGLQPPTLPSPPR